MRLERRLVDQPKDQSARRCSNPAVCSRPHGRMAWNLVAPCDRAGGHLEAGKRLRAINGDRPSGQNSFSIKISLPLPERCSPPRAGHIHTFRSPTDQVTTSK